MVVLLLALLVSLLFIVAYFTYGRWLGHKLFQVCANRVCPSLAQEDGVDFVPSPRMVVFGHHFTSIAGTGPIVGPAIGVIWGWVPALLWVVFGSIFLGALHDFGSLMVSLRHRGKSIGDLAGILVGPRARWLFMLILVLALTLVLAVFGLVIASVFRQFPSAIFPCLLQIPLAMGIGLILRQKRQGLLAWSLTVLLLMMISVVWGDRGWLHSLNTTLAAWPVWAWTVALLAYCYAASVLPVWLLLQPRDFINSLQLLFTLALLAVGLVVAALFGGANPGEGGERLPLTIVAPAFQWNPAGAPAIFPFLFITIACGAISGFHSLVSSGTSSKQLRSEKDAQLVSFGAMLTEGFLATLVIFACVAGLGLGVRTETGILQGAAAWAHQYASWGQAGSLSATIGAFVTGSGNFLATLGLSPTISMALMGVFVASFAATTMDSACRLQRYVIQELALAATGGEQQTGPRGGWQKVARWLAGSHGATLAAVVAAGLLAAMPPLGQPWTLATAGKGGMTLWPLFGAMNQLVAGMAFMVIAFYLRATGRPWGYVALPLVFMLVLPFWAMFLQVFVGTGISPSWVAAGQWPLVGMGILSMLLEIWLMVEAWQRWPEVSPPPPK